MPNGKPPFRADHVGSLLRPRALVQARHDHDAGRIDAARLRAVEHGRFGTELFEFRQQHDGKLSHWRHERLNRATP